MTKALTEAGDFFHTLQAGFAEAEQNQQGNSQFHCQVGPRRISWRFANGELVHPATMAFRHLALAQPEELSNDSLTVYCWDSESTGVPLRLPDWQQGDRVFSGVNRGRFRIRYQWQNGVLHAFDKQSNIGHLWIRDHRHWPIDESASPARTIIGWWLDQSPFQLVHAGAVGLEDKGVLITGHGGSGKSTTCSLALHHGLDFLGDDFCLVDPRDRPTVYSIYSLAKLNYDVAGLMPRFEPCAVNAMFQSRASDNGTEVDKAVFDLNGAFGDRLPSSNTLRAIIVPEINDDDKPTVTFISPAKAMAAMAPSTVFILSTDKRQTFTKIAELTRILPCYKLQTGRNPSLLGAALRGFIDTL